MEGKITQESKRKHNENSKANILFMTIFVNAFNYSVRRIKRRKPDYETKANCIFITRDTP